MARNINKATETVFEIAKLPFFPSIHFPADFDMGRYIQGDAMEIDWLTHCKIRKTFEVSNEQRFAVIELHGALYFVIIGFELPSSLPEGINNYNNNSGLFTAIIYELELPIKLGISNIFLEQNILSQSVSDHLYLGHDYLDLCQIFPQIHVFELTAQYSGDPLNIYQLILRFMTLNREYLTLPYSIKTLESVELLICTNSVILNYENILMALLASHFKFSFLDFYRCIELLYQIIYVDELYISLTLAMDKTRFLTEIEDTLSWKPLERVTLQKIISSTPKIYKANLDQTIKKIKNGGVNYSDWLYHLRCDIVHLKTVQEPISLKNEEWDGLIRGVSDILFYWYYKYQTF